MSPDMTSSSNQNVYNVSKLNNEIKRLLEGNFGRVWLSGEISNFVAASSGHWYFTLKDHKSQIKCAMFRGRNRSVSFFTEKRSANIGEGQYQCL